MAVAALFFPAKNSRRSMSRNLREAFADPRVGLWNDPEVLAKAAGTSIAEARRFLRRSEAAQTHSPWRKPKDWEFAPTGGERGEWLGDVITSGTTKNRTADTRPSSPLWP